MPENLKQIDAYRFKIPKTGSMKTDGLVFADRKMIGQIQHENSLKQIANVAHLPGIVGNAMAMPDIHLGYGFPIGGVAAMDTQEGVISPGGVGYDINCGVRLMATDLSFPDVKGRLFDLSQRIAGEVPAGVGRKGRISLGNKDINRVLTKGASWAVEQGYGEARDLEYTESGGRLEHADPELVSDRARARGADQLGTLGSGNHFIEIGVVEELFDKKAAQAFGLEIDQVTVLLHSGSRGLGYQVCDDALHRLSHPKHLSAFDLPDRQLACAPFESRPGQDYFHQMNAAANYAWANRQVMMHFIRETFSQVLSAGPASVGMRLVYDICHNIAKVETHEVDRKKRNLLVHRKGATRSFGPGHPEIPGRYRDAGQPVLVPGDMGRYSYVLAGTEAAMFQTFGSTCHGAGRLLSRKAAKKQGKGRDIAAELEKKKILVTARAHGLLAEEMSEAYKDVQNVVDIAHGAGISKKVARLRPLAVIKG